MFAAIEEFRISGDITNPQDLYLNLEDDDYFTFDLLRQCYKDIEKYITDDETVDLDNLPKDFERYYLFALLAMSRSADAIKYLDLLDLARELKYPLKKLGLSRKFLEDFPGIDAAVYSLAVEAALEATDSLAEASAEILRDRKVKTREDEYIDFFKGRKQGGDKRRESYDLIKGIILSEYDKFYVAGRLQAKSIEEAAEYVYAKASANAMFISFKNKYTNRTLTTRGKKRKREKLSMTTVVDWLRTHERQRQLEKGAFHVVKLRPVRRPSE